MHSPLFLQSQRRIEIRCVVMVPLGSDAVRYKGRDGREDKLITRCPVEFNCIPSGTVS